MPNLWRAFERLLPGEPLLIADVLSVNADGTRTVQQLDGGVLRVTGEATVGQRVFVRAGAIEGPAPTLTSVTIEI